MGTAILVTLLAVRTLLTADPTTPGVADTGADPANAASAPANSSASTVAAGDELNMSLTNTSGAQEDDSQWTTTGGTQSFLQGRNPILQTRFASKNHAETPRIASFAAVLAAGSAGLLAKQGSGNGDSAYINAFHPGFSRVSTSAKWDCALLQWVLNTGGR